MRRVLVVLVLAAGLAAGVLPAVPALAACPAPGGASIPNAEPAPGDLTILGRGWGHGVGMSQHGAQGAARLGCTHEQILAAYYPGTQLASRDDQSIIVGLFPNSPTGRGAEVLNVQAVTDGVAWRFVPAQGEPIGFPQRQPGDALWQVAPTDGGGFAVVDVTGGGEDEVWSGDEAGGRIEVILDNVSTVYLPSKEREYRRGRLNLLAAAEPAAMRVQLRIPSIEQYLYGLAEVSASWPAETLQAQAVTGRSYAVDRRELGLGSNCACHVWDSPSDQAYAGLQQETGGWPAAVNATSERVLTHDGGIAETYYSSTHGGQSEALEFGAFFPANRSLPYLRPFDDSAWELASDSDDNGVLRWSQAYSWEQVGEAFGVGTATRVSTPDPKGAGGRVGVPSRGYGGVVIEGTEGSATVSGLDFVQRLGVNRRSERFAVVTGVGGGGGGGGGGSDPECAPTTDQSGNTVVTRSSGPGRVETAVDVSRDHWETADDFVLATAGRFPDALAAGALAARLDAPVLLTTESELSPQVAEEVARLGATTAHVLGGDGAIGPRATEALAQRGVAVRRLAGPS
ncbi:MAG: cell wall-binding repeat-containing protein, partial [Euzebyales bacterium]|nr:cell wall-binding repeat-containing protein [Euzebyales bacterium]